MRLRYASEEGRSEDRWEPDDEDGDGNASQGEAERGGRVAHRVGAGRDDDAPGPGRSPTSATFSAIFSQSPGSRFSL